MGSEVTVTRPSIHGLDDENLKLLRNKRHEMSDGFSRSGTRSCEKLASRTSTMQWR
jgi:hypothetical protein